MQNIPIKEIFARKDTAALIRYAEQKGQELVTTGLSTSQIRNILDAIQAMHTYDYDCLQLLRAKLAYAAGKKREVESFRQILEEAISCVKDKDSFIFFRNFVEAIVAYHTLAESRKKSEKKENFPERRNR
ncbi:MAG: type III-A CRISPR-associated protein Csm2 [candidate division WOR-3 bacterium]